MPDQSPTPAPPGTACSVHVLTGGGGRRPVVSADARHVLDQPVTYLHVSVDDRERTYARHLVDVTFSGSPDELSRLVAEMAAAVASARPEGGPR